MIRFSGHSRPFKGVYFCITFFQLKVWTHGIFLLQYLQ